MADIGRIQEQERKKRTNGDEEKKDVYHQPLQQFVQRLQASLREQVPQPLTPFTIFSWERNARHVSRESGKLLWEIFGRWFGRRDGGIEDPDEELL